MCVCVVLVRASTYPRLKRICHMVFAFNMELTHFKHNHIPSKYHCLVSACEARAYAELFM